MPTLLVMNASGFRIEFRDLSGPNILTPPSFENLARVKSKVRICKIQSIGTILCLAVCITDDYQSSSLLSSSFQRKGEFAMQQFASDTDPENHYQEVRLI